MVIDLDETLIHSVLDGMARQAPRSGPPPDFVLKVDIEHHPVRFSVHKRPHVDYFLSIVSIPLLNWNFHSFKPIDLHPFVEGVGFSLYVFITKSRFIIFQLSLDLRQLLHYVHGRKKIKMILCLASFFSITYS